MRQISDEELRDIERFSVSAWYYPGTKPEGDRDAKTDIANLIAEVRRLTARPDTLIKDTEFNSIVGAWPGNETDDEINQALGKGETK